MSLLTLRAGRTDGRPSHVLSNLIADLTNAWTISQARRTMGRLDDAALLDIGVPRGDIEAAVRYGRCALRR